MIWAIQGELLELSDGHAVIEDASGVSWDLIISSACAQVLRVASAESGRVRIFTHLYHREDQMSLFGFADRGEREVFLILGKVNGIGPKQSIRILSSISPSELALAVSNEDEQALTSIPGIGAKGAKKLILHLKDQLGEYLGSQTSIASASDNLPQDAQAIIQSLVNMGFDRKRSRDVIMELKRNPRLTDDGEILRQAIISLS